MANRLVTRLVLLFFLAQLIGIVILSQYIDFETTSTTGVTTTISENYIVEPPTVENENYSFVSIIIAVVVGTIIILWLIKMNAILIWKIWFMVSVSVALTFAFFPLVQIISPLKEYAIYITVIIALLIGYFKIFKANYVAHTVGELFIYGGLAALFVPILNLTSAIILLLVLAVYDYYMVNKAGHMVTLANASMDANLISGLYTGNPNERRENEKLAAAHGVSKRIVSTEDTKIKSEAKDDNATSGVMVGGGDIAFPLFFAGALMKYSGTLLSGVLVAVLATVGLIVLFSVTKRGKFYPAIPFVGAGCFVALGIVYFL